MSVNPAYPKDLAEFVSTRWDTEEAGSAAYFEEHSEKFKLPSPAQLEQVLSTCFQASLMLEEHRSVVFRVVFGSPSCFPPEHGPPTGLHRLEFTEARKFSAAELRRLSPAVSFHRSLIGVHIDEDGSLSIWGFVHSGPRWLRAVHGGRGAAPPMPPTLVVNVTGPGRVEVLKGKVTVGQLVDGRIWGRSMNVFASKWLSETFLAVRKEHWDMHLQRRAQSRAVWADLNPDLLRVFGQHMVKRVITAMRTSGHGGTLVVLPEESARGLFQKNPFVSLKYKFAEGEPRARFKSLLFNILDGLAEYGGRFLVDGSGGLRMVDWEDYEATNDQKIADLDEAIFEVSHLIAGLTSVDGAVLMTQRFELLGFGAEIYCENADVTHVARALDLEGSELRQESVEGVGTRHRSAFRLCNELAMALAIVVSQDGSIHFVRKKGEQVVYWDHQATVSSFDF
ncbi:MAG TPA: hypothetical protein V6C86_02250 [Oculatellaceae cyanobacterium]